MKVGNPPIILTQYVKLLGVLLDEIYHGTTT